MKNKVETRICKLCGGEKTLEENFYVDKLAKGGRRAVCKECYNKKVKDKQGESEGIQGFRSLSGVELRQARQNIQYKVAMMVAECFGKSMTRSEIARKCGCKPSTVTNIVIFLRKNGINIPKGVHETRQPARYVAIEDIKRKFGSSILINPSDEN
jgi:hypothetical protein